MPRKSAPGCRVTFDQGFLVNPDLSPPEKTIILALAGRVDFHLQCDSTKEQLATDSGISERRLWVHLQALKAKGFISWRMVRFKGKLRNVYTLLSPCQISMVKRGSVSMSFRHGSSKDVHTPEPAETPKDPANHPSDDEENPHDRREAC